VSFTPSEVLLFILSAVLLFAFLFYLLERRSLRYLRTISDAVSDIAGGDLDREIAVEGDDEFSLMAQNINNMAGDIKVMLARERESEKNRNELITNIAHDLKTPLTSVIGYLDLLSGRTGVELTQEQQHNYLVIVCNKAKRLEQLIEDLFGFTKLSFGKMTMRPVYIDIVKLLEQLLEEQYPEFEKYGMSYDLKSNVDSLEITGDSTLIARLFENLIGNAIKYGEEGKRVEVRITHDPENDAVAVAVKNYGFVIPEEEQTKIFEKFYRVDKARSSNKGGSGLGLAIAKDIAELHDGSISVTSDLSGTVFTVRLRVHLNITKEYLRRA
jgi:signal transduction histidine kinase